MADKKKIDQVIVVEGRDDTANLKRFYDCMTYETGGSSIDEQDLERLKRLQASRGLIVFTDPDFQGERIRKIIMSAVPDAQHAFIQRDEGRPKKQGSLGVEHADFEALERAFEAVNTSGHHAEGLSQTDLISFGLVMASDSRQRREYLCHELRIGYANGKQLLKRLNMFGIALERVEELMRGYRNDL
ncbi:ribonuclease M5 [Lactococcus termiticola]|uniref:Ribonuclease M5 n=1 Tax=Lactococcus termiticola TaxID=2169526 RepID=A0A2R5HG49_9LACT|nr:ribonuclease M5 [Lactococcus termiticola]GBG96962.1 ribonuclease M5 [Lactococcus termiticola]